MLCAAASATIFVVFTTTDDHGLAALTCADTLKLRSTTVVLEESGWKVAVAEGERRVENSIPPGYMDADKLESDLPEGASGDYLVWLELLLEGEQACQDLVLVTSDTKEDWWNRADRGPLIGPRRELVDEYFRKTGRRFFLLEPSELLNHSDAIGVGTSAASVEDIERVQNEVLQSAPWTIEALKCVLIELDRKGHSQGRVIREAAASGGRITRQRVYEIDGRDEDRMLRGYTRPVRTVIGQLQESQEVPLGVQSILNSVYETGVQSSHFAVPAEVVVLLNTDREGLTGPPGGRLVE